MSLHPFSAARRVCQLSGGRVSNLALNKILYVAQMIYLGQNGGAEPLISERFEAWDYGPVLPSVYRAAKPFGSHPVRDVFGNAPEVPEGPAADALEQAVKVMGNKSPGQMVAITHWEQGAWARHYVPGAKGIAIPDEDILAEYRVRVGD